MTGLPVSYQVAWGIHERTGRGPKRGLSLDRIVEAGVAVAAAEGLEAVSMSRVAATLRASTMSLYRYVGTKDELLMLMMDAAFARAPAARRAGEAWRAALTRWARAHLAVLRRHPWIVRIPVSGPPITPHQVVWFERALRCLTGTGLSEPEKLSTLLLVNGFVRNEALLASDLLRAVAARGATMEAATASYRPDAGVTHRWPAVPRPERNDRLWRVRSDRRCGRGFRLRARADPRWDRGARAGATARMIENATNFQFPEARLSITNYQLPHSP